MTTIVPTDIEILKELKLEVDYQYKKMMEVFDGDGESLPISRETFENGTNLVQLYRECSISELKDIQEKNKERAEKTQIHNVLNILIQHNHKKCIYDKEPTNDYINSTKLEFSPNLIVVKEKLHSYGLYDSDVLLKLYFFNNLVFVHKTSQRNDSDGDSVFYYYVKKIVPDIWINQLRKLYDEYCQIQSKEYVLNQFKNQYKTFKEYYKQKNDLVSSIRDGNYWSGGEKYD